MVMEGLKRESFMKRNSLMVDDPAALLDIQFLENEGDMDRIFDDSGSNDITAIDASLVDRNSLLLEAGKKRVSIDVRSLGLGDSMKNLDKPDSGSITSSTTAGLSAAVAAAAAAAAAAAGRRRRSSAEIEDAEKGLPPPSWQNKAADKPHREAMVKHIAQLLKARKKAPPSKEWLQQLPHKVRVLEESLYSKAQSLEAYLDKSTLKLRLRKLAVVITAHYKNNRNTKGILREVSAPLITSSRSSLTSISDQKRNSYGAMPRLRRAATAPQVSSGDVVSSQSGNNNNLGSDANRNKNINNISTNLLQLNRSVSQGHQSSQQQQQSIPSIQELAGTMGLSDLERQRAVNEQLQKQIFETIRRQQQQQNDIIRSTSGGLSSSGNSSTSGSMVALHGNSGASAPGSSGSGASALQGNSGNSNTSSSTTALSASSALQGNTSSSSMQGNSSTRQVSFSNAGLGNQISNQFSNTGGNNSQLGNLQGNNLGNLWGNVGGSSMGQDSSMLTSLMGNNSNQMSHSSVPTNGLNNSNFTNSNMSQNLNVSNNNNNNAFGTSGGGQMMSNLPNNMFGSGGNDVMFGGDQQQLLASLSNMNSAGGSAGGASGNFNMGPPSSFSGNNIFSMGNGAQNMNANFSKSSGGQDDNSLRNSFNW